MTDLEHELTRAANNIHVAGGDVDMVTALGRRRHQRRRGVLAGVTAIALVGGLAAIVQSASDEPTPVATTPGIARGNAGLRWEVLSSSAGLGYSSSGVGGAGPFYALSTAPGQADVNKSIPSRVLYRSTDGVEWSAATTLGNDLYLSDLAPVDGRVYAVGTAPAQAGVKRRGDLVAGWSDDGGKHFSKKTLPIDWSVIEAGSTAPQVFGTQIASTEKGTVVTASVQAPLDVSRLLPAGATAPDGWATTANGVDVLGPEKPKMECPAGTLPPEEAKASLAANAAKRVVVTANGDEKDTRPKSREIDPGYCMSAEPNGQGVAVSPQDMRGVVHSYTWADLNVTGDLLSAATHQLFGFFAPSGSADFARVDLGGVRADSALLDADDDGFHVLSMNSNGNTVSTTDLSSADGQAWTSAAGPSDLQWVTAAGTVKGVRIVIGDSAGGTMVARSTGGGQWTTTALASVMDPSFTGGRAVHSFSAGVGPLGVVIAVTPDLDESKSESTIPPTLLAFSRDGATWETSDVETIAGHKVGSPVGIFVSGQRAVVSLSGGSTQEGKAPKPQTVLVATPA